MSARLLGGRYQLHTQLGRGGMAAVWAGIDTRLDRPVAVKVLDGAADPVLVQRLEREARTVAGLAHPNVVAVYDVGTEDGVPYLVMELVEGENLHHRLTRGPLDAREAVRIADEICAALQAAHEAGVVHRDIKPDNILLTRTGTVKVCDFGIAALQQAIQVHLTSEGTVVGTSEYMAPEQATGGAVDTRSDLYALGCVLYAMLTGRPPFVGDSPMRVLWQQVHEAPAPVAAHHRQVSGELQSVVTRLLAKDPADRPASAAQVRALLAHVPDPTTVPSSGQAAPVPTAIAAGPPTALQGRAAVPTHTRAMPVQDLPADEPHTRNGLRLGPLGIAAVAVGAAAVTALVIALFSPKSAPPQDAAPATSTASAAPSVTNAPSPTAPTSGTVTAVRAAIQAQIQAGEIDADEAGRLSGPLEEIDRNLARGRADQAAKKVDDLRGKLDDLRHDGKITTTGYRAILSAIDQLARTLPRNGDGHGGDQGQN